MLFQRLVDHFHRGVFAFLIVGVNLASLYKPGPIFPAPIGKKAAGTIDGVRGFRPARIGIVFDKYEK
jgi:hypothetical protein